MPVDVCSTHGQGWLHNKDVASEQTLKGKD